MKLSYPVLGLWIVLILGTLYFAFTLFKDYFKKRKEDQLEKEGSTVAIVGLSLFTQFFDTLGIGSFAPMTSGFRIFKLVQDKYLPGTLNVAATIPVNMQAIIFIRTVEVEPITLISMLFSALLGALVGASFMSKLSEKKVRLVMSISLFILAFVILAGQMKWMPLGGDAVGLTGLRLVIAIVGNFVFGALMTAGVGLYAPCLALVYLLGMSSKVAFPIMMGSCAILMPYASIKFIKANAYNARVAILFLVPGIIAVSVAAFIVGSMNTYWLTWLILSVLVYTSISLFLAYKKKA